jgi:hypothetical protein
MASDPDRDCLETRLRRAKAQVEQRIHAGEDCFAEEYFAADPGLAQDVETALDLIYTEFDAYRDAGRLRSLDDYYGRFPQWRAALERQFIIDEGLREESTTRLIRVEGLVEQYDVLKGISQSPNGNIVKARHVRLGRLVAIKTFAGGDLAELEHFKIGAREQKRLEHPNILPVFDVGESEDGQPSFTMEFADSGSLDQHIAGRPQAADEAARLVRMLAQAMSTAHREGIVHRDLKPANILLQRKSETRNAESENGTGSDFGFRISNPRSATSVWPGAWTPPASTARPAKSWARHPTWHQSKLRAGLTKSARSAMCMPWGQYSTNC